MKGHGVVPDIVTMAKGIGNGFPLAAVVTTPEIAATMSQVSIYLLLYNQLIFARPKIWRCKAMLQVWPTKMWASKWTPLTWMKLKNTQTQFFVSKIDFILSIRSQRKSNQPYIFERDLRKNFILFRLLIRQKKLACCFWRHKYRNKHLNIEISFHSYTDI